MINSSTSSAVLVRGLFKRANFPLGNINMSITLCEPTTQDLKNSCTRMRNFFRAVDVALKRDDKIALRNSILAAPTVADAWRLQLVLACAVDLGSADCVGELLRMGVFAEGTVQHSTSIVKGDCTPLGMASIRLRESTEREYERRRQVILHLLEAGANIDALIQFKSANADARYTVKEYLDYFNLLEAIVSKQEEKILEEVVASHCELRNSTNSLRI